MTDWKKTIWKVPLFCVIFGSFDFWISVYMLVQWVYKYDADGTTVENTALKMTIYGLLFVGTFLLGGLVFFRKMSKREIFWSATVLVVYGLIAAALDALIHISPRYVQPFGMSRFILEGLTKMGCAKWLSYGAQILSPYLFVLFGKKESER